jgi:cytochrome c-type biogenesis protein CcsB
VPVNETLSQYSDWSYTTAAAIYVLALIFFLVERIGRMGAALTVLGVLLHFSALLLRGLATHRVPWGNMYEYIMAVTFIAVVTLLYVIRKFPVRHFAGFLLFPITVLMFIGGTVLYTVAAPVVPALQSYWLVIHVSAAASSSGIFLVPGVASILYMIRSAYERNPQRFARFGSKLPAAEILDRVAYRTTVFAFPLFTFGVLCGAIWAESAWGRFWGWDPKETTAFIAWVVYAAYLHSRATAGWRGTRAAVINTLGFAVTVFNLFFVNLVTTGLHSYAGVG